MVRKNAGKRPLAFRPMVMSQVVGHHHSGGPFFCSLFLLSLLVDGMAMEQLLLSGGGDTVWVGGLSELNRAAGNQS